MRNEIKWSMLLYLRVQICFLSSVEFLRRVFRNEVVWFLYLVLKSFSVSPIFFIMIIIDNNAKTKMITATILKLFF